MRLPQFSFDTSDVSKPHSYMIWMLYDNNMKLIPEGSGAKRVTDPNQLGTLIEQDIPALTDGYLHCFVSNTGLEPISYDNFMVTYLRGKTRQINHYYPYGLSISSLSYSDEYLNKYTSKELQTGEFGGLALSSGLEMFDFGSRFYDPALGRWFTPDPAEQFANPYLAMGCNPVVYVDPDGEFVVALLTAMAVGALIGAGTSAAIYSVTAGINGSWNWNDFGRTAAFGAVGGALGGGLGFAGAALAQGGMAFGQSLGYNVLSNVASNSATTLAFGGELTAGSLAGMAVGGAIGAGLGNFKGVKGGALKNIGAELGFGTAKGAVTGLFGSGVGIAVDGMTGNPHASPGQSLLNGMVNGAIAGGTVAGLNIATMGAAYIPKEEYGEFGNNSPVYRRGHFLWPKTTGIALGRNLVTRQTGNLDFDAYLRAHETGHYVQQSKLGFANFYGRVVGEYSKDTQVATYDLGGRLEFGAQIYSLKRIGYFWSPKFRTYINNSNYNYYYPNVPKTVY